MLTELTHNDLVVLIIAWSAWLIFWAYLCGLSWKCDDDDSIFAIHVCGSFIGLVLGSYLFWDGLYSLLANG